MRSDGAGRSARVTCQVDHGVKESPEARHWHGPASAINEIDADAGGREHVVDVLIRVLLGAGTLERSLEPVHRLGRRARPGVREDHEIIGRGGEHQREVVRQLGVACEDVPGLEPRIASDGQQALLSNAR